MRGWYKRLNSGCKMRDFAKFCRLQEIQPTRVFQNITVCVGTVLYARCHALECSEMKCMRSIKYNICGPRKCDKRFQSPLRRWHDAIASILLT